MMATTMTSTITDSYILEGAYVPPWEGCGMLYCGKVLYDSNIIACGKFMVLLDFINVSPLWQRLFSLLDACKNWGVMYQSIWRSRR